MGEKGKGEGAVIIKGLDTETFMSVQVCFVVVCLCGSEIMIV